MDIRSRFIDANGRYASATNPVLVRAARLKPPSSIAGDSSVEVTDAINAWLASSDVPAGSTIDMRGLTHWSDRAIKQITKPLHYLGDGWTLQRKTMGPRPRPATWVQPHLWVHPQSIVENVRILGTNLKEALAGDTGGKVGFPSYVDDYAFEAGIRCDNPDGFRCSWELIDGVWGDGIQTGGRNAGVFDIGGAIGSRSILGRIGRQGITPSGRNADVHDFDLQSGRRSGLDLEPDPANPVYSNLRIRRASVRTLQIPIASAGDGDVNDILIEDFTENSASMPVIYAKDSSGTGRRDRWTIRRWNGSPSNTSAGTPALRVYRGRDWLIEDSKGFGATGVAGAVKGMEFVSCGGTFTVRRCDLRPKGTIVYSSPDSDFVLVLGTNGVDDNIYV